MPGTSSQSAVRPSSPTLQAEGAIDAPSLLKQDAAAVADQFSRLMTRYPDAPRILLESIEYSLTAGGKRLRPTLLLETYRACSSSMRRNATAKNDAPLAGSAAASAMASAVAMELIHTFSLVHDDLPAMDDDDLRRGRPTNHKVYGEAMAILAGDAMTTMAFEIIAADADPKIVPSLIRELAHATGPSGMIGGQVLDMDGEGKSLDLTALRKLHAMKTGALLTCCCRMGAIAASADEKALAAVASFGQHLGLAFQIIDDVLDQTSTSAQLGKATNKDAERGKNTFPALMGLDESRREAQQHLEAAMEAIALLGDAGDKLRMLGRFVVEREH